MHQSRKSSVTQISFAQLTSLNHTSATARPSSSRTSATPHRRNTYGGYLSHWPRKWVIWKSRKRNLVCRLILLWKRLCKSMRIVTFKRRVWRIGYLRCIRLRFRVWLRGRRFLWWYRVRTSILWLRIRQSSRKMQNSISCTTARSILQHCTPLWSRKQRSSNHLLKIVC